MFYRLGKIEKEIVPSREERMENIGEPKPPKMGSISPTSIQLPEVDDLLAQLHHAPKPKKVKRKK